MDNNSPYKAELPILIIGGGITGPVLAYWLHRGGRKSVIVERSPSLRPCGQNIDVRGAGREILRRMNLEQKVKEMTTTEEGVRVVDESDRYWASFAASKNKEEGGSFTAELEILRSDLAGLLYDATKDLTKFVFGEYVDEIEEKEDHVRVHFHDSNTYENFSFVVGADGVSSKTRRIIFGEEAESAYHSLDQFMAFFALPDLDTGRWARWLHIPGGRSVRLRPNGKGGSTVILSVKKMHEDIVAEYKDLNRDQMKEKMSELFGDVGWLVPQLLNEMKTCTDFYTCELAQIKLSRWSSGRVVLVGDAAYCPTPLSGLGTSVGITGAYVLAGEICTNSDHLTAFRSYEETLRPYVEDAQRLSPALKLTQMQSWWGVYLMRGFSYAVSWFKFQKKMAPDNKAEKITLQDYRFSEI